MKEQKRKVQKERQRERETHKIHILISDITFYGFLISGSTFLFLWIQREMSGGLRLGWKERTWLERPKRTQDSEHWWTESILPITNQRLFNLKWDKQAVAWLRTEFTIKEYCRGSALRSLYWAIELGSAVSNSVCNRTNFFHQPLSSLWSG